MKVWTHRGFPFTENQIESFQKCYKDGIRHFETDIHATRDGVLILSHDSNILRLTGLNYEISQLDFAQLNELTKNIFQFSKLEDLINLFPDVEISIDIKHEPALIPLINLIKSTGFKNLVVGSFNTRRINTFRSEVPNCRTALTSIEILKLAYGIKIDLGKYTNRYAMVPIKFKGIRILTKKFLSRTKLANIPTFIWTVNSLTESIYLAKLEVSGIVTDDFRLFV